MAIIKLVTKEPNQGVVNLVEDILARAKSGEITAIVAGCATSDAWETNISEGTPMLEAMGYMDIIKSILATDYMDAQ